MARQRYRLTKRGKDFWEDNLLEPEYLDFLSDIMEEGYPGLDEESQKLTRRALYDGYIVRDNRSITEVIEGIRLKDKALGSFLDTYYRIGTQQYVSSDDLDSALSTINKGLKSSGRRTLKIDKMSRQEKVLAVDKYAFELHRDGLSSVFPLMSNSSIDGDVGLVLSRMAEE